MSAADLSQEVVAPVQGTEDLRKYSFTLKGQSEEAMITFYDFPGGWMNPYDESQSDNFSRVTDIVRKSSAIIVAVNTPYIMEEGGRYRDKAAIDEIEYILRTSFSDHAAAKLIAIVPIKCEKYIRTPEGLNKLNGKMSKEFASTFGLMKNPAYSRKLTVEVIPVQTAGNAEFSSFTLQDGQIISEVYMKAPGRPFSPKDADKLLVRICSHLEESLRPPAPLTTYTTDNTVVSSTPSTITRSPSSFRKVLAVSLIITFAGGTYIYSYMYYNAKRINEGYTSKVSTLTAEVANLRKKIADDESEHSHQDKLTRAKNNRELDELRTRLKAVEAERDKAISDRDQALRSEAATLSATEQAKAEADRVVREHNSIVATKVAQAVEAEKAVAKAVASEEAGKLNAEITRLKAEVERLRKAEADRKTCEDKEKEESPEGLFQRGLLEYMSKNYSEAFKLFTKSAEKGNAEAENMIGLMHSTGLGVSTNEAKAKEWYRKAAIHGSAAGQYNYGLFLEEERKYSEAKVFYEMAAEQEYSSAMVALGGMYYDRKGVSKSAYTAFTWYKKAADLGDYYAMNLLGFLYFNGEGVGKNYSSAFTWGKKSAECGNVWGQYNLAWMYENGYGTARDLAKAREWYEKAAAQGNEDAKTWLSQHQLNGTISRSRFETFCTVSASYMKSQLERLKVSSNFRFPDGDKPTLLMIAATKAGSADTIETLISMGADVNAVDATNWTALIWALQFNRSNKSAIVRSLLENGAKVVVNGINALSYTNDASIKNLLRQYQ